MLSAEKRCASSVNSTQMPVMPYTIGIEWQVEHVGYICLIYPKAEAVGNFTVFNIKGNRYRLIVDLVYASQRIYIKYVLTHAEYDKDEWKNDSYF